MKVSWYAPDLQSYWSPQTALKHYGITLEPFTPLKDLSEGSLLLLSGSALDPNFSQQIEEAIERGVEVAVWGAWLGSEVPAWLPRARLVGLHASKLGPAWVKLPCPSCLHSSFDHVPGPSRPLVALGEFRPTELGTDVPTLDSENCSLEEILAFLASGEAVVTNRVWGAYWAALMLRRVVLAADVQTCPSPFALARVSPSNWRTVLGSAPILVGALDEARRANHGFLKSLVQRLGQHSEEKTRLELHSRMLRRAAAVSPRDDIHQQIAASLLGHSSPGALLSTLGQAEDEQSRREHRAVSIKIAESYSQKNRACCAIPHLTRAQSLNATDWPTRRALALVLQQNSQVQAAEKLLLNQHQDPNDPMVWEIRARASLERCEWSQAESFLEVLLQLSPESLEGRSLLGMALTMQGRFEVALQHLTSVLQAHPNHALTRLRRAFVLLWLGRYEEGWQEYEWRLLGDRFSPALLQPEWQGKPFPGQTLLVRTEQGVGDSLQFARFLPRAKALGGTVLLAGPCSVTGLLECCPGVDAAIELKPGAVPEEPFDLRVNLLSLPARLGLCEAEIGMADPYLFPREHSRRAFARRLEEYPGLKVGLAWAGSAGNSSNTRRSFTLSALAPLAQVEGILFVSLQKGEAALQACFPPSKMELLDWTEELFDFAETAALVQNLDLVITPCTAIAHLAGGLGVKTWTLLSYEGDWRWQRERSDTPWYPSMRLFRQPKPRDWNGLMEMVERELKLFTLEIESALDVSNHT